MYNILYKKKKKKKKKKTSLSRYDCYKPIRKIEMHIKAANFYKILKFKSSDFCE